MGLDFTNGSGFVLELKLLQVMRFAWTMWRSVQKHARIVYFSVLLRCVKYRIGLLANLLACTCYVTDPKYCDMAYRYGDSMSYSKKAFVRISLLSACRLR